MSLFRNKKIAIFTDIHIGVHHNSKFFHDVSSKWASWFISEIKSRGITDIVFCGDYFHTRDEVSVDSLHFGTKLLEEFKDFNVHMIVGNHDCFLKDSSSINSLTPFNCWPNVSVYSETFTFEQFGKKINFIPWGIHVENIPKADITFGHFEIRDFKMNSYALCEDGIFSDDILDKSKLVITGHFHLRDEREYDKGKIIYTGNPFQMDFNDAGTKKGFYLLDIDSENMEFVENRISPKHINIKMSELCSESGLNSRLETLFNNNLVKLKVDRRVSSDDMEYILMKLKNLNPLDLKVDYQNDINEYGLYEEKRDLSGIDIKEAIIEFIGEMDIDNSKEVEKYLIGLYDKLTMG